MAKRKQVGNGQPESWPEVDVLLRRMGEISIALAKIEADMNIRLNEVKTQAVAQAEGLKTEYKALEKNIRLFCDSHKEYFTKSRSKTLDFGTLAYRVTKRIIVSSKDTCLAAVKALNLTACIKVTEQINKESLEALDDNTLAKLGVTRRITDKLRIEPNLDKLRTPTG